MRTIHAVIAATVIASASTIALMTILTNRHSAPGSISPNAAAQDEMASAREATAASEVPWRGSAPRTTGGNRSIPAQPSEKEVQQQADALMRQYEAAFQAETVSPAWANTTELAVVDALRSPEAKAAGVAMPTDFDVECRSSICRVNAAYSDDGSAVDAATVLAMDVSRALPRMQRRTTYNPDGSVSLQIYALR